MARFETYHDMICRFENSVYRVKIKAIFFFLMEKFEVFEYIIECNRKMLKIIKKK